jgi:hypothetical protein
MTDPELAELIKKVAQAEKRRRLTEIELAEMQQARAAFEKAEAALHKFYAKGPHKKKKPGRPGFWKSPEGHLFVLEVDRIVKERGCKIAFAIRIARKKTIEWSKWVQTDRLKGLMIARATRLAKLTDRQLETRYQEARRYWSFLIDPEAHQKGEETLRRNFDQALAAWRAVGRNPYDFT